MAREPKHDDGSTINSPHRVYPPNFYTLIFRNHKTPRELKENPLSIYRETSMPHPQSLLESTLCFY